MTYYIGNTDQTPLLGEGNPRYFYALRSDEPGLLTFTKVDQLLGTDDIEINEPGAGSETYEEFEYGVDFFEGRLPATHLRPYENLRFDQYRFDNKNIYYYINDQGSLFARTKLPYSYT